MTFLAAVKSATNIYFKAGLSSLVYRKKIEKYSNVFGLQNSCLTVGGCPGEVNAALK